MATTYLDTSINTYVIGTHDNKTAVRSITALDKRPVPNVDDGVPVFVTGTWRDRVTTYSTDTPIEVIRYGVPAVRFAKKNHAGSSPA